MAKKYYIVTGGAGFIGSNLVKGLNNLGIDNIIVVDNLANPDKFKNIVNCEIADYMDKFEFIEYLQNSKKLKKNVQAILHQGACSNTMETDGRYMMQNNYQYSVDLFNYCKEFNVQFLYASSASVYGAGQIFKESREHESPLNVYGYSKFLFDQYVRRQTKNFLNNDSQVVGFRYFNVYGINEFHKGKMASVALHGFRQLKQHGFIKLFKGCDGYADGEQRRDFVSVEDVVKINLHFLESKVSGVYNLGTGNSQTFNDLALATVNGVRRLDNLESLTLNQAIEQGLIQYVDFPEQLKGKYQSFTQADISALRQAGYDQPIYTVEQGVERYVSHLASSNQQ